MSRCNFVNGQKVVCIRDRWYGMDENLLTHDIPTVGAIYTIAHIQPIDTGYEVIIYLTLKEMAPHMVYEHEGFRPLQDRPTETDISIFKKMETPNDGIAPRTRVKEGALVPIKQKSI